MKCKYCQAELDENVTVCPVCGQEQMPEEPAAPAAESAPEMQPSVKMTPGKIAAVIVAGVLVLALLIGLVMWGIGDFIGGTADETVAPTETVAQTEATEGTVPTDGNADDVTCKGTYTVSDEEAMAANGVVVATMGGKELTNGQLQAYYWAEIFSFLSQYGDYAAYFGLDLAQPLDTQICAAGDVSMTWQQYFLSSALNSWRAYQALAIEGEENNTVLSQEFTDAIENVPSDLVAMAEESGYENVEELLLHVIGPGGTQADYTHYMDVYYRGYMYFGDYYEAIAPTAEEVEAYYAEYEDEYTENGVTKDGGIYVDVRHTLICPEGGTPSEDGNSVVYSDEEWEACRVKAQALLDEWLAGDRTEDSFAQLAIEHSEDPGSASDGGLYENVFAGQMVPEFNDWCFDESRQFGDYGLVKTSYGYHIMFFVGSRAIWYATAETDLIEERASALVPAAMEKHPAEIDYSAIKLGFIDLMVG